MEKLSKGLFWASIIYFIVMMLVNMESTFNLNATQYIPDGQDAKPIRIASIIRDIVSPAFQSAVLLALSYILKHFSKEEKANI